MPTDQPLTTFLEQSDDFKAASSWIYKPLDSEKAEVRLVHVQPAADSTDELHLTLEIVSLDDKPVFQALSYTWGEVAPGGHVYLYDIRYNITRNQDEALRRFRLTDQVRVLWIDVFSINQIDLEERGSQVSMMGRIYSSSQQTQIWLGEADAECVKGLTDEEWAAHDAEYWQDKDRPLFAKGVYHSERDKFMPAFLKAVEQDNGLVNGAIHILRLLADDQHYYNLPSCYLDESGEVHLSRPWYEAMQTLKAIMRKPWWTRVWTTQEAMLSPTAANVHFGKEEIPFTDFLNLGRTFVKHGGTTVACCVNWTNEIQFSDDDNGGILALFLRPYMYYKFPAAGFESGALFIADATLLSNGMKTTDPRDYVYGVLGLTKEDDRITVDYTQHVGEVFSRATIMTYMSRGSTGYLTKGTLDCTGRTPGLPSWCVDWANQDRVSFRGYETFYDIRLDEPRWAEDLDFDFDRGYIYLDACQVSSLELVLEQVAEPHPNPTEGNGDIVRHWTSCLKEAGVEADTTLDPETNSEFFRRFFKTIFRDTRVRPEEGFVRLREEDWEEIQDWWNITGDVAGILAQNPDPEELTDMSARARRLGHAFHLGLADSTMAVTKDKQMCLVPLISKPGDFLYHIKGGCTLTVLRKVDRTVIGKLGDLSLNETASDESDIRGELFQVVGPCYMNDFMGREKFESWEEETVTLM